MSSLGITPEKWNATTFGSSSYLRPRTTTRGLLIGNDIHNSLSTAYPGASALFNGQTNGASDGGNYFVNAAYGSSFGAFGGIFAAGHAQGTASAPSQTLAGNWLGGLLFTGYSGTAWNVSGAGHFASGFWGAAATDVTGSTLEVDLWIGGLVTRMIAFETDTNAIKFNEALLDCDMTFYHDTNVAMFIQGSDGFVGIGDPNPTTRLMVMPNAAYAAPTLGTVSGGFSVHGDQTSYGFFLGVANTGTTWMQSMRKDGSATAYGLSLNPSGGGVGVGVMSPTAYLHLRAGTTAASGAPLKFNTGTNMTTAEVGAMEFTTGRLYFTPVLTRNIVTATTNTNTTAVGNITTGEDDLITYSIPANTLGTNGDYISFRASGTIANSINAKRLKVKYGATTVMDTGAAGIPVSTAIQWVIEGEIIRTGATAQKCNATLTTNNATLATYSGYSTAGETLSGAVTLKLTGEATSTDDIVQETFTSRLN